jgi:hypothetical protein
MKNIVKLQPLLIERMQKDRVIQPFRNERKIVE